MDSELLLKFIEYFPDYLSVLSRTLYALSKQVHKLLELEWVIYFVAKDITSGFTLRTDPEDNKNKDGEG